MRGADCGAIKRVSKSLFPPLTVRRLNAGGDSYGFENLSAGGMEMGTFSRFSGRPVLLVIMSAADARCMVPLTELSWPQGWGWTNVAQPCVAPALGATLAPPARSLLSAWTLAWLVLHGTMTSQFPIHPARS